MDQTETVMQMHEGFRVDRPAVLPLLLPASMTFPPLLQISSCFSLLSIPFRFRFVKLKIVEKREKKCYSKADPGGDT